MPKQEMMEKVSNRIWVLLAGIAVAIAIAISALAFDPPGASPQAGDPTLEKPSVSTIPSILLKKIYYKIDLPSKPHQ